MIRTQIQLPDELYDRAKRHAEAKEISLAELARRGIELLLSQYPAPADLHKGWRAPSVRLGWKGWSHEQIKDAAQRTAAEERLAKQAKRHARV